jgi:HEAT repeat protein
MRDESIDELEQNRDVSGLIAMLDDRRNGSGVRGRVALALGRLGQGPALPALRAVLSRETDGLVIRHSVEAISMFPAVEAVPVLVGLLDAPALLDPRGENPSRAAHGALLEILRARATECPAEVLDRLTRLPDKEAREPVYVSGDHVGWGADTLDCSDMRDLAAAELERRPAWVAVRDTTDVGVLLSRLRDPDTPEHHRIAAAETLAAAGDASTVEPLAEALQSGSAAVRSAAAVALAGVADQRALGAVLAALEQDRAPQALEAAFERIAALSDLEGFLDSLGRARGRALQRVIDVVSRSGDARAVEPLMGLLEQAAADGDLITAESVLQGLESLGPTAAVGLASVAEALLAVLAGAFASRDRKIADKATALLKTVGESQAGALIAGLSDGMSEVRWAVAQLLGDLGARDAIPALRNALDDPDEGVREAAGVALERIEPR